MNFPGRLIQQGEADRATVAAIQQALAALGYGPFTAGVFDAQMAATVRLFQSQHVDREGRPLGADGVVGPMTWGAIFGGNTVPPKQVSNTTSALAQHVLTIARAQIGVMEQPVGSNRGPQVDQYLERAGIDPVHSTADQRYWCMAFAYWCVDAAAGQLGVPNPLAHTAGVLDQWNRCAGRPGVTRIDASAARANYGVVEPGQILILDHGGGLGHTGIVSAVDGPHLTVVEGNANASANSRNGIGVFETNRRTVNDPEVKGFIDY